MLISASTRKIERALQITNHPKKSSKGVDKHKLAKKSTNAKYSTSKPMKSKSTNIFRNKSNI